MPPVSNVKGQPVSKIVVPEPAANEPAPLPASLPQLATPLEPEPAIPIDQLPVKSQDELAAESIAQQTVANKRTMTPLIKPPETAEERVQHAKRAIEARWSSKYDWENSPLDEALEYLAAIRLEVEKGGLVLERRVSQVKVEIVKCYSCENMIEISQGRWAGMRTRNNYETGIAESAYACSAACYLKLQREFVHPTTRTQ